MLRLEPDVRLLCIYKYLDQKPDMHRYICSFREMSCSYAEIQNIFGTVYSYKLYKIVMEK